MFFFIYFYYVCFKTIKKFFRAKTLSGILTCLPKPEIIKLIYSNKNLFENFYNFGPTFSKRVFRHQFFTKEYFRSKVEKANVTIRCTKPQAVNFDLHSLVVLHYGHLCILNTNLVIVTMAPMFKRSPLGILKFFSYHENPKEVAIDQEQITMKLRLF